MSETSVKHIVLQLARKLPDDCTWDDVKYWLYVCEQIDEGRRDIEAGRLVPHADVVAEFHSNGDLP